MKNKINKKLKLSLLMLACLLVQIGTSFAQTTKSGESKKFDINDLYSLASETEVAEVTANKDFIEALRKSPSASNESACKLTLAVKKLQRGNDEIFDTLVASQRLGNRVTGQTLISPENEIARWVRGRAGDRIALNKVIGIYKCLPPEQVKEEIQSRIVFLLKNLGNLAGYIDEAKKLQTLSGVSSKDEICAEFSAMKKESDKIEPDLEEFAMLYVADGDTNSAARSVEFAETQITQRAEKILNIRAKLFLPLKADIKANFEKYGCK